LLEMSRPGEEITTGELGHREGVRAMGGDKGGLVGSDPSGGEQQHNGGEEEEIIRRLWEPLQLKKKKLLSSPECCRLAWAAQFIDRGHSNAQGTCSRAATGLNRSQMIWRETGRKKPALWSRKRRVWLEKGGDSLQRNPATEQARAELSKGKAYLGERILSLCKGKTFRVRREKHVRLCKSRTVDSFSKGPSLGLDEGRR